MFCFKDRERLGLKRLEVCNVLLDQIPFPSLLLVQESFDQGGNTILDSKRSIAQVNLSYVQASLTGIFPSLL